jgi:hypothetical protein
MESAVPPSQAACRRCTPLRKAAAFRIERQSRSPGPLPGLAAAPIVIALTFFAAGPS